MYVVTKRLEIAGAHRLALDYESPCQKLHGHNWIVTVEVQGLILNPCGMLIDFTKIKKVVNQLDHANINDFLLDRNPTAEVMAEWIANKIDMAIHSDWPGNPADAPFVSKVLVQEAEGNVACFTR